MIGKIRNEFVLQCAHSGSEVIFKFIRSRKLEYYFLKNK